ncbi:hypothetical protein Tco_1432799, partial [Tanacetum coccineum]
AGSCGRECKLAAFDQQFRVEETYPRECVKRTERIRQSKRLWIWFVLQVEVLKADSILDGLVCGINQRCGKDKREEIKAGMVVKTRREWRNNTVLGLWRWKFKSGGFGHGRGGARESGRSRDGNERIQRDAMLHVIGVANNQKEFELKKTLDVTG